MELVTNVASTRTIPYHPDSSLPEQHLLGTTPQHHHDHNSLLLISHLSNEDVLRNISLY